jgi:tetratricopeptide (TPR) repeat protein
MKAKLIKNLKNSKMNSIIVANNLEMVERRRFVRMFNQRSSALVVIAVIASFVALSTGDVYAQSSKKQQELMKRIEELERAKALLAQKKIQQTNVASENKNLDETILRYEKILASCDARKTERCADVIYTLGGLYYEKEREDFIKAKESYEERMRQYDDNPRGPEPVNPIPKYDKSLGMYERLDREYPDFPKLSEAYYQMGNIYMFMGDLDNSKRVYTKLVEKFPNSPRQSGAHFRLADFCYLDHDNVCTIKHLEKIKQNDIDIATWEMVHYRKGEVYYNMGEFDKAIDLLQTYVDKVEAGLYPKGQFHDIALEYIAIAFSDMGNGAQEAISFFKKIGNKPYEAYVMYTIGLKNRVHGQFDDAIVALTTALKTFPNYKDAPAARMALIECFVVKKEHEKANLEREKLVDDYVPGKEWYNKNKNEKEAIDKAKNEVKRALSHIAIYYHAKAQKSKDKSAYDKALSRYNEFFQKFPDDKWKVFELKYNVAEIYSATNNCEKAADAYNFVAMEDLSTYPPYKVDIDTLGMDQDEVEKIKQGANKATTSISQEDAGYNVVVALENCRKKEIAAKNIKEEDAYDLPLTKKLLEFAEKFQGKYPKSQNAAEVLYLAGNIHFNAKNYASAIRVFKQIGDAYPQAKIGEKAIRMLANSYSANSQFDMAMSIYRQLLNKLKRDTPEHAEVLDLAAGAMYKRAESIKKTGNVAGAIDAFKSISDEYPNSKVADRGWFEAGVCYEEQKNLQQAASTFENLAVKFPKSPMRENAYIRAAENYKKSDMLGKAAQVYQTAANNITKAEYAIPSLSSASECYQKLNQFDMAGKMFELIYERYSNDPKTPQALYNAGLIFEKGKLYTNAINVYDVLAKRFPQSEYASEAFFSIGLCYEKMGQNIDMARVFTEYATKFANDRFKQVQALVKAGDAYFNLTRYDEAIKNYEMAVSVYEKFNKESDIDVTSVAQAYFKLGEVHYKKFQQFRLSAKTERDMKTIIREKTKALEAPAKNYAKVIELGIAEWTLRATFMIGMGFVDMADAVANQTLFGNATEKTAAKITILSSLDKYYAKAQEYFFKNIEWAHSQNLKGEYVDKSIDRFMEMCYKKGYILEEVGEIFANSPIPSGLSPEEKQAYEELLQEKRLAAMDAALPKYEDAMQAAKELGIANSEWIEKIKARIREINPDSKMLEITIDEWKPIPQAQPAVAKRPLGESDSGVTGSDEYDNTSSQGQSGKDEEYERSLRRIRNIVAMEISVEDKIRQLNRIEMDAKRNIILEEEKIEELKGKK